MLATRGGPIRLNRVVPLDRLGIVRGDFGLCAELDPPSRHQRLGLRQHRTATPPHPAPRAIPVNEEVHVGQGAR